MPGFRHQKQQTSRLARVIALGLFLFGPVFGQQGDRTAADLSSPPAHWVIPPSPVRTPEETIALFDLPPGFRAEIVAAEPLVQDPIGFTFDHRGRLWVLEWPSYNWPLRDVLPGLEPEEPPASRIVILEDEDGDGRMDRREVFMELDWPRGIQAVADGVVAFALPDIVFSRPAGQSGAEREVLFAGLPVPVNPHAAPSSPLLAMDNWIYSLRMGERIRRMDGGWVREPSAILGGQWGMQQDNYGRLYFSYNQQHLRGSPFSPHYFARNPNFAGAAGADVRIGRDETIWPHGITAGVNRAGQLRDDGTLSVFSANVGPAIYRGGHFPPGFVGNAFVAETVGRLVRRSIIQEKDGLLEAENAYDQREFLFSHDERFRPTFTMSGPDGALYIADMYRGIIEGHLFFTTYLRNQVLKRDLHRPFYGMGRIYRIVHTERKLDEMPRLQPDDLGGWVAQLGHPNGFWRDTAQRLLVEGGDRSVAETLRAIAHGSPNELEQLHALWTLEGMGRVDERLVLDALGAEAFRIRMAALRLAEPLLEVPSIRRAAFGLDDDPLLEVRRQLLFTLGETSGADAAMVMAEILRRDSNQPYVVEAALTGLHGREGDFIATLASDPFWKDESAPARRLFSALGTAVFQGRSRNEIGALLARIADEPGEPLWRRKALLQGMAAASAVWVERPGNFHLLEELQEPELREAARKVRGMFAERGTLEIAAPAEPAGQLRDLRQQGRELYVICAACHQPDGRGLKDMAPPLAGSPVVGGAAETLIGIILRGRVGDPAYPDMPPLPGLSDEQIAAILSYVRTSWGNDAEPVNPEQVAAARESRGEP